MPSAHCSGGTIKILREQEKHTTITCAQRILIKRNNLDPERTRMTTHSSRTRTSSTGKENRVDLVLRCCRWDHKNCAPLMRMADSGASKPRYTSGYWLFIGEGSFDRQIKLEVTRPGKFSTRKPDLWRSTAQWRSVYLWIWWRLDTEIY